MRYPTKNGRFDFMVQVPASDVTLYGLLKYADMSEYTAAEIARLTGTKTKNVTTIIGKLNQRGYSTRILKSGRTGRPVGSKPRRISLEETDTTTQSRLKKLMLANHDSCNGLAQKIGASTASVCRWVFDGEMPSMKCLMKIANNYHVQVAFLAGETRTPLRRY